MVFNTKVKIFLYYALICLIWGTTWLAIRSSLESLTPFLSAGLRFTSASILLLVFLKIKKIHIQKDKRSIQLYFVLILFWYFIPYGLVYWAEQFIPSGLASVLFAIEPFFIVLFSYFYISSEKISLFNFSGIVLGFAGILVIYSDTLSLNYTSYTLGISAIVLSACLQAINAVIIKKYGGHLDPLSMNFIPMLFAGIMLSILGFFIEDMSKVKFDLSAVGSVLYLALFGSIIANTSFYWLLKRINVVILSLISFITPIIALYVGWVFYNEKLSSNELIGSLLVLAGLLWANAENVIRSTILKKKLNAG